MQENQTVQINIPDGVFLKCYRHLLKSKAHINFLWGGRDSGKSYFIACLLVIKCLVLKSFRCVLIRKTYASIHDSQFQLIKDVVETWGLSQFFTFTTHPLRIRCVNGNTFIARGCDEPQNLKSITNPTHAWFEEGNQLTEDEYSVASSTLRSNKTKVQQWFSFNPECKGNYKDFWLYKVFFADHDELTFTASREMAVKRDGKTKLVKIDYTSTHTTYDDNEYCTDERRAALELLEFTNPFYHKVYTLGIWGNKENKAPFAYAFEREKHVKPVVRHLGMQLIASFDFNKNPITCFVGQILPGFKVRGIEQVKLKNSDIYALCAHLRQHYPNAIWTITGDATGNNTSALVKDNLNYYRVIKSELKLSTAQFKVPKINPNLEDNQLLVNAVLALLDVQLDPVLCKGLIFDLENVSMLPSGEIDKSNRQDEAKQADALDCFRYFCNAFLKHILIGKMIPRKKVSEAA